jgi:hypothetical protein
MDRTRIKGSGFKVNDGCSQRAMDDRGVSAAGIDPELADSVLGGRSSMVHHCSDAHPTGCRVDAWRGPVGVGCSCDPKKRSEVIKTLEAVAKALPRPTPAVNFPIHLKPNSLGAALIAQISTGLHQPRQEAQSAIDAATAVRPMWVWLSSSARDSTALLSLSYTMGKVLLVLSGALIVEWLTGREFNRRLKKRFEELGIELANPTQTVMLQRSEHAAPDRDRTYSDGAYNSDPGPTAASPGVSPTPSGVRHD